MDSSSFCQSALRMISLGKYQTTLYNKHGSAFQSSVVGGIVTILSVAVIGTAILQQLVAVFSKSHYNLDVESQLFKAYQRDENSTLH